jgi:hypothetical protein
LLAVVAITNMGLFARSSFGGFLIPAEPGIRGIGGASIQTLAADLRTLEGTALLFRSEEPAEANSLAENVNHVGLLARRTDFPTRFGDTSNYGFFIDSRGWWLGVAVQGAGAARETVAQAAGDHAWYGSPDTMTVPGNALFGVEDGAVWKLLR